jgi:hypothetical protein
MATSLLSLKKLYYFVRDNRTSPPPKPETTYAFFPQAYFYPNHIFIPALYFFCSTR